MQEFDDFADYVDQNGHLDLYKSWFHSNFLLGMDVCIQQTAFQMEELFKGSLFTCIVMQIIPKSRDSFYHLFLTYFSNEN